MKRYFIFYCLAVLLLSACGSDKDVFVIKGTLNNLGGRPLYAVYEADNRIVVDTMRPEDGRIAMRGSSAECVPVQLYDAGMRLFMRFYLQNGDRIELEGDAEKMYEIKIKGNDLNRDLWQLICRNHELFSSVEQERRNAGNSWRMTSSLALSEARLDSVLTDYITHHRSSMLSSILLGDYLLRQENYVLCDSLWQTIDEDAKLPYIAKTMERMKVEHAFTEENNRLPHLRFLDVNDSVFFVNPRKSKATLLYIWAAQDPLSCEQLKPLAELADKHDKEKLQVVALSIDSDTAVWHRVAENGSESVVHLWCESAYNNKAMQRYNIAGLPTVMLGDSLGRILVRTSMFPDIDIEEQIDSLVRIPAYKIASPIFKP